MTYLLHDGYRLCDVCFALQNVNVTYTYERRADTNRPFQQDHCDACWTPLLISDEAAFKASVKSMSSLLAV